MFNQASTINDQAPRSINGLDASDQSTGATPATENTAALARAPLNGLKALRHNDPFFALGLAVSYLMTKTPFCNLKFGDWSRILTGQINRGHYFFAMQDGRVVGFAGWALSGQEQAEAWLDGQPADLGDGLAGDCVIINIWEASSDAANAFMRTQMRKLCAGQRMLYAKRVYANGKTRPVRLKLNQFAAQYAAERAA